MTEHPAEFKSISATEITTRKEGEAFIEGLHKYDLMFHFEDSIDDIIVASTGHRLFSDEEVELLEARLGELYSLDWSDYDCPIGYALHVMGE